MLGTGTAEFEFRVLVVIVVVMVVKIGKEIGAVEAETLGKLEQLNKSVNHKVKK